MIYQKLIPYYLILRELILKYIFGRIKMLNFKNTYYPVRFYLPYLCSFLLEFFTINYIYQYDNINYFQDYEYNNIVLPPLLSFKINGKDYIGQIKKYQSNVPIIYFLHDNKIVTPTETEITYFSEGSMKNKNIKNLLNFTNFRDIFNN